MYIYNIYIMYTIRMLTQSLNNDNFQYTNKTEGRNLKGSFLGKEL